MTSKHSSYLSTRILTFYSGKCLCYDLSTHSQNRNKLCDPSLSSNRKQRNTFHYSGIFHPKTGKTRGRGRDGKILWQCQMVRKVEVDYYTPGRGRNNHGSFDLFCQFRKIYFYFRRILCSKAIKIFLKGHSIFHILVLFPCSRC